MKSSHLLISLLCVSSISLPLVASDNDGRANKDNSRVIKRREALNRDLCGAVTACILAGAGFACYKCYTYKPSSGTTSSVNHASKRSVQNSYMSQSTPTTAGSYFSWLQCPSVSTVTKCGAGLVGLWTLLGLKASTAKAKKISSSRTTTTTW